MPTQAYITETVNFGLRAMDESVRPLYAAAPVLLKALERLVAAMEADQAILGHDFGNGLAVDAARKAIRQARGQAHA